MSSFRNFLQENMRNAQIFDINNQKNSYYDGFRIFCYAKLRNDATLLGSDL